MNEKVGANLLKISPIFAHYGVDGGATTIFANFKFSSVREEIAVVGDSGGNCTLYSLKNSKKIANIFEDKESRQIVALGEWKFSECCELGKEATSSSEKEFPTSIWIHFRSSSVEIFQLIDHANVTDDGCDAIRLKFVGRISTSHYGFCRAVGDWRNDRFILPDYEDECNIVKIRYKAGGEKCFRLDEKFLIDGFIKRQSVRDESRRMTAQQIAEIKPFKGMLMGFEIVDFVSDYEKRFDSDCIFMAFEDSTIALFNFRLKQIIDFLKHPKHHQFVCWAVTKLAEADGRTFFAISVMKQVYLAAFNCVNGLFEVCCLIRKTQSITCTAIEIFVDSRRRNCVACGLNSGCVEIFALDFGGEGKVTPQKFALIDFHAGSSITCLVWKSAPRNVDESVENEVTNKGNLLFVSCSGGKLSLYNL